MEADSQVTSTEHIYSNKKKEMNQENVYLNKMQSILHRTRYNKHIYKANSRQDYQGMDNDPALVLSSGRRCNRHEGVVAA